MQERSISHQEVQDYVTDFWDIMSEEERTLAINEGFKPPTACELIIVDFTSGLGEIGRYVL